LFPEEPVEVAPPIVTLLIALLSAATTVNVTVWLWDEVLSSTVESSALTEEIVGFWLSIFNTVIGKLTEEVLPAASATVMVLALVLEPKAKS
jgi:hypothetical protein